MLNRIKAGFQMWKMPRALLEAQMKNHSGQELHTTTTTTIIIKVKVSALPDVQKATEPPGFQNSWALPLCPLLCNHVSQSAATQSQKLCCANSCYPAHTMPANLRCPSVVSDNCNLWLSSYRQSRRTLSCWDYRCDIITVARQHLNAAQTRLIPWYCASVGG